MRDIDLKQHIANIAEDHAILDLERLGYNVHSNGYHDHADLVVNDILRVEVKASTWVKHKNRKGRYQFNTRNHPDLYLCYCIGTQGACFVIPGPTIGDRQNIAIYSQDPQEYQGQWAQYFEAWHIVKEMLQ